jgi:hypothetical protein
LPFKVADGDVFLFKFNFHFQPVYAGRMDKGCPSEIFPGRSGSLGEAEENSPRFQPWVAGQNGKSPAGAAEGRE